MKNFAKVFLLCGMGVTGVLQANDYFPYQLGDTLSFEAANNAAEREVSVLAEQGNWTRISDFLGLGEKWVYAERGDSRLWIHNPQSGYGERLVDLDAAVGTRFNTPLGGCQSEAQIGERGLSVETVAGRFDGVVRVDFSGNCADAGLASAWFAPQAGVVRYSEQSIIGPVAFDLAGGNIGELVLPALAGLGVSAQFPINRVMINDNDHITVGLTLSNSGNAPVELTFPSSQRFDVLIFDANGGLLRQWSANKRFAPGVEAVSIAPGASEWFGTEMRMITDAGQPLDVGSYVMRIELTGYATPDATAFSDERIAIEVPLHIDARMSAFGN